jgi:ABC-type branched-subunit amino acid transport system substrate-binding protein
MRKKIGTSRRGVILYIEILTLVLLAYGSAVPLHAENVPAPYKVGVLLPLTGFAEVFGAKVRQGIDAAVHANVQLIFEDDM